MRGWSAALGIGALAAAAWGAAGCGETTGADPCAARLDAIEARLAASAAMADPTGAPVDVPLPSISGVPLEGAPPIVVVTRDDVSAGGREVGGGDDLERLADTVAHDLGSLARASRRTEGEPWPIALWAEPDLPVERLARILSRAPDEARFALLGRGSPDARAHAPDAPEWVNEALGASEPGDPLSRREHLDDAWARATRTCPVAASHLPVPAPLAPAGPPLGRPSTSALVAAMRTCGCDGTDLRAMEAVATAALASEEGPVRRAAADVRFGRPSGPGREVVLDAEADVSALAVRLAELGAGPTVFVRID